MTANSVAEPIVVGVDGSPGSKAALVFALREGLARGCTVQVVTTWLVGPPMRDVISASSYAEEEEAARALQDTLIAEALAEVGEVPDIARIVVHDVGGATLIEAARGAAMLVVGSGRKGALTRAFLGSVSEFCVRHATVPVVVVPDPSRIEAVNGVELEQSSA